ncbi:MAG: tetratricopeptide repeat protein [Vicinamibacterales bacterium]
MAKQRRVRPRPALPKTRKMPARRSEPARGQASRKASPTPVQPPPPVIRTTYIEAVALYEKGLQALQAHEFGQAADILRSVLANYPDEKELHERVQLYLNICDRQNGPQQEAAPSSVQEKLYAATLALNAGEYAQALGHIGDVVRDEPFNDHAHYMRAVVLTLRGELPEAVPSLLRAIELNPENRGLARQDPDLEPLRHDGGIRHILDVAFSAPRPERRRGPARSRR